MKELFKTLPKETQKQILHSLTCYDECTLEFYNGEYHVSVNAYLLGKYPNDFKVIGKYTDSEFFEDKQWYTKAWDKFCLKRHQDKTLQAEVFDKWADEQCEQAIANYIK